MSMLNQLIVIYDIMLNVRRNRKLEISRAPTKARSREPAYSQALRQKQKSIGSGSISRESGRKTGGYGGWCLELRRGGRYGEEDEVR